MEAHARSYELVVAPDGSIPAIELARVGLQPGTHLRVVPELPAQTSIEGQLPDLPALTWNDFERASQLAKSDLDHS